MTIQKVIEIIERKSSIPEEGESFDTISEAFDIAVEALKEVEQYQKLGTVEELKKDKAIADELSAIEAAQCYAAVSEWKKYQEIGTVEECREARERQRAKKAISLYLCGRSVSGCPTCRKRIGIQQKYCEECGRRIDWGIVTAWQQLPEQHKGDEKNIKKSIKAYIIPCEAWYKNSVSKKSCIYIGLYREGGGTEGEFEIAWDKVGIQLEAYSDSWEVLRKMPELTELMAKISREELKPTINEFAEMLNNIGFKDITERERRKS